MMLMSPRRVYAAINLTAASFLSSCTPKGPIPLTELSPPAVEKLGDLKAPPDMGFVRLDKKNVSLTLREPGRYIVKVYKIVPDRSDSEYLSVPPEEVLILFNRNYEVANTPIEVRLGKNEGGDLKDKCGIISITHLKQSGEFSDRNFILE